MMRVKCHPDQAGVDEYNRLLRVHKVNDDDDDVADNISVSSGLDAPRFALFGFWSTVAVRTIMYWELVYFGMFVPMRRAVLPTYGVT